MFSQMRLLSGADGAAPLRACATTFPPLDFLFFFAIEVAKNTKGARLTPRAPVLLRERRLLLLLVDELGHLEHVDPALSAEHGLEGGVGVDHAAFLGILKLVLLDVRPETLRHVRTRARLGADDCRE